MRPKSTCKEDPGASLRPPPLPRVMLAVTSGYRQWTGPAGRARAARGTPGLPAPRNPPGHTGTVRPARCPWPLRRAAAGRPRRGSGWQGGAAQLAQGASVQRSRDREAGHRASPGCYWLGLAALPGAPVALGKTRSFGTAGKAHLGGEEVTAWPPRSALPSSPEWPSPQSSGS